MTEISLRLLKEQAMAALNRPRSPAQETQRNAIMNDASVLFALYRPAALTFAAIAHALDLRVSTLRTCFSDMDGLLGAILFRHLDAALLSARQAGQHAAARQAYLAATRAPDGGPSRDHKLFLAYRHVLAPDQIEDIEARRAELSLVLGGDRALELCDCALLSGAEIEHVLTLLSPSPQSAQKPAQLAQNISLPKIQTPSAYLPGRAERPRQDRAFMPELPALTALPAIAQAAAGRVASTRPP